MSQEQPWDIQEDESQIAYEAFLIYLRLGSRRSIDKAYRESTGKEEGAASGQWNSWCQQNRWVERCRAYDKEGYKEQLQLAALTRRRALAAVLARTQEITEGLITAALKGDPRATRACLDALGVVGVVPSKEPVQLVEAVTDPEPTKPEDWGGKSTEEQNAELADTIWG